MAPNFDFAVIDPFVNTPLRKWVDFNGDGLQGADEWAYAYKEGDTIRLMVQIDPHDLTEEDWLNEGCSGLAEYVAGYGLRDLNFYYPARDSRDPLTDWKREILDYEQTALFMLYVYEQFGKVFIKDIVLNPWHSNKKVFF